MQSLVVAALIRLLAEHDIQARLSTPEDEVVIVDGPPPIDELVERMLVLRREEEHHLLRSLALIDDVPWSYAYKDSPIHDWASKEALALRVLAGWRYLTLHPRTVDAGLWPTVKDGASPGTQPLKSQVESLIENPLDRRWLLPWIWSNAFGDARPDWFDHAQGTAAVL